MKLFITGASGFLGKYVVAEAVRQGYAVKAVVRPATDTSKLAWADHPAVELVRVDLRQSRGIAEALSDVDCVIHLAAVKGGDFYDRFAGTVLTTENLLGAMTAAAVKKLVATSTFSVYDYFKPSANRVIDEAFPIESEPEYRDAYAQTKLIQEDMMREWGNTNGAAVTLIRPGMIYGREALWNACHGADFGSKWLLIGPKALIPVTYVENCAEAIVLSVGSAAAAGEVINVVDDNLPTRRQFTKALVKRTDNPPQVIPMPWGMMRGVSSLAWFVNQQLLKGKARLPGLLIPASLDARLKPFRYTNAKAKKTLNWSPRYTLETALDRSVSDQCLLSDMLAKAPATPTLEPVAQG
ncbi:MULTISPECIES: NAD-dependent epimerase/dehydratase family protein [Cyanophyceae]|uniref:NAD-dependent epimerase/dehydratase family protein n=1 Tax=Cyanophyceae TaxID=3028117 RepID=UPI0016859859|nr:MULTISPECIES: NAD-dependent epimerase/dehydratase family protein [Cyanophyceae]MBD1918155.1 NAD-dependent epimerase/dehydratase family protein [Phormidium sp. FACHB-77]MBD2030187.1 NAD-dependent epimerase/dehydratase family protein [Phormidium sp. FACHB-322]MBD2051441.1 NAD-dependent epimerase/dehydratase family protein [Leptolyngbya sp. FACHB-60]